uniref:Uncharacterized protein n=1 Tax=Onchocerca volvulus TaxID=6282 RepID=A0A8R1XW40_ONCVO
MSLTNIVIICILQHFMMVQLLLHCSLSPVLLTVSSLSKSSVVFKIVQLLLSEQQRHQQQLYYFLNSCSN